MARKALGRGLNGLIGKRASEKPTETNPAEAAPVDSGLVELDPQTIDPNRWQPRADFDEEKLRELADSIREQGLVQPLAVRRKGGRFEVIAGERRLRAVKRLGWEAVPAVIMDAGDARMRELALVENLQRDDLNPIETASAYAALREDLDLTHEQIAQRLGVSRARVTNALRLLELPEEVKSLVVAGTLSAGHARALLALEDPVSQLALARRIEAERLSVRQTEALVAPKSSSTSAAGGGKSSAPAKRDPHVRDLESRLREHLGTKVAVQDRGGKGSITIDYYSPEDAARILGRMGCKEG